MNRKRIFSRKQKRKSRGSDSGAANRFLDQFDTKLRFRELEPRVVLTATAIVDGDGVLQITTDAPTDDVEVRFYDKGGVATYEVTNDGKFVDEFAAATVKGIEANDVSGSQVDSQQLTLLDDHATLDPNLSLGLETKGIEEVVFKGSALGDSWTFDKMVTIEAVKYDAEVSQNGADLLTPIGTPVTFFAIDGAKIDVNLQSTTNEISQLAVGHGGEVKIATSQDLAVNSSNADLLQLTAPNVELGADTFSSQFGALKIDLTGSGDITQKGDVTVTGATDLDVIGGKVLLNNSGNDFQGPVSVNALNVVDADTATIADTNDLQLGDIRSAKLTAITGGNLTQASGTTVEVTDLVDFQFTSAGKTLDLQNAGNLLPSDDAKFLLSGPESPTNFYLRNDATDAAIPLAIATLAGTGSLNDLTLIYTQNTTAIALPNIDITGDLVYQAKGVIAQTALTSIKVDGNASFKTLDDQSIFVDMADNEFTVVSATGATQADVVAINDNDGGLDLDQIAATTLTVHTVGALGNVDNASVVVSGNAKLTGDSGIALGSETSDLVTFGTLTFISPAGVAIEEDDSTLLTGKNSASTLDLDSTGKIENVAGTELKVAGNASLTADDGDDLNANNQITLGQDVTDDFEFLSLTFNSVDAVKIAETGDTDLVGKSTAGSLELKSSGSITNQDNAELNVVDNASFIASTAITLGNKTDDSFKFGTLTFDASGAVSIAEDDSTKLSGKSKSDSLVLDSTGAIQNAANAEVVVTNNAKFIAGTSITLGNETSDVLQFGSLTFDSDFGVSIKEDDSTVLSGTSQAATLLLQSTGSITNEMNAKLYVDVSAQFIATDGLNNGNNKITLGDQTGDVFQFGTLRFDTVDAVSIAEDNDTLLEGASKAGSLYLASTGKIENKANASLTVGGNAEFSAGTDVKLGNQSGDSIYFGTLTFAGNVVAIAEDDATVLTGTNTATSLDLKSTDTITDEMATSVMGTGPATFTAANEITLADDADTLHVTGLATFESTADKAISIGDATSSTQFGSLNFNGGAVDIQESDATILSGANTATSVILTSGGSITDASKTTVEVTGAATFAAKDEITLANENDDKLDIGGLAKFTSSDNDAIAVGDAGSTTYFGSLTFSGGMVVIQEDDSTLLAGTNAASSLNLESGGAITDDSMTKVTVTGAATFTAKDEITLANETDDKLDVGGLATFKSLDGDGIAIGASDSLTYFGSLNFNGGVVVIQEDDSTLLTGNNSASSLELSSLGKIENDPGTKLIVSGNAKFTADDGNNLNGNNQITLGQDGADDFEFGSLTFNSVDTVTIAETGGMLLTGSNSSGTLFLSATGKIENLAGTKLIADGVASLTADDGDNLNANNQITLGQNGTDDFEFLALTFNSADAVKIAETGNTQLTGSSSAGSLALTSTGKIENAAGTKLIVAGNASLTADDGDDLNANNQISLGQNGTDDFEFGSLTFNSADTVVIAEIGDTHLTGESAAKTLNLSSTGKIDNEVGAKLIVTSGATFTADDANAVNANNQILLGQDGADDFEFGSLTFNTVDAVKIAETGSTFLENKSTAGSLELKSTGSITNQSSAKLDVTGNAYFMASVDITLGDQVDDKFTFGSLTFDGGAVVIQEDDSTELSGSSSASSLELTSGGAITDASTTEVEVVGSATFTAKDEIVLANETDDKLEVGGLATFKSLDGDAITLGASDSTTKFGSLNFNGGVVVIQEDDSTLLTGSNTASSLELSSLGKIENVAGTKLIVSGNAKFTADDGNAGNANNQITLGQDMTDDFEFVSLTFNTVDAVKIAETGSTDLAGMSTAGSLELKSTGSITNQMNAKLDVAGNVSFMATVDITLGDQAGDSFTFQSLTFDGQTVAIEEDDSTKLSGMNSAASLELKSGGSITDDTATSIDIGGAATFQAQDAITLADNATDVIDIGGLATFVSLGASAIDVGVDVMMADGSDSGAKVNFGQLTFVSDDGMMGRGAVTIREDSSTEITGDNKASDLFLASAGAITDDAMTTVDATGAAVFTAKDAITLADMMGDELTIDGMATFISLDSAAIEIGGDGLTLLGMLNFNGGAVVIQEDDSTQLSGDNVADSLELTSDGSIEDKPATSIDVENDATFTAATFITLADNSTDVIDIGGLATFVSLGAGAIDVGVDVLMADGTDSGAKVNFGQLTFVSDDGMLGRGAVTIREDSSTEIAGENKASDLFLASAGSLTDDAMTKIDATGAAVFTAQDAITLADVMGDELTIDGMATFISLNSGAITIGGDGLTELGMLNFDGGAVVIQEDDATQLSGDNFADSLELTSAVSIEDKPDTSIDVENDATFTAGTFITLSDTSGDQLDVGGLATFVSLGANAIDVGVDVLLADGSDSGAMVNFGQLTFVSDDGMLGRGAVTIREDSSTEVTGDNAASDLFLASAGAITDDAMTTIDATGAAKFIAQDEITLADVMGDELTVGGLATFISLDSGAISIGGDGLTLLGMLNFNTGGAFFLQEDDSTELTGDNVADSVNLNSDGAITDAEGTSIDVENAATFTAATFITLADKATDVIDIGSLATFVSLGASAIDVGVDVVMADGSDSGAKVNFVQLTFVSDDGMLGRGAVTIREDSSTEIAGDNKASDLFLASAGAITDADSTQIDATGAATFTAQDEILLADASGDVLHVGGLATFTSLGGDSITVGGDLSDTRFGSLTFNGGDVFIQEDDSTELTGVNIAASLNLLSDGAITDATGTSVMVNGDATFTAGDKITLADEATDELQIVGLAKFVSVGGATIDVGVDVLAGDGSDSGAKVDFGQLTFVSDDGANGRGAVTIREDSSMEVTGVNLAASLFLAADGSIIQVEDGDGMTADRIDLDVNGDGTVVGDAVFEAAAGGVINLFGDTTANPLGEPVSTFLADNKIKNAEFRAAGGGSLSDVYYRNISTAALFPTLPDTITGDLRIQFTDADMIVNDNVNVGDQLILEALGSMNSISDVDGVSIAANDAIIVADGTISLADESLNSLKVVENAFFYSRGGNDITVGASDTDGTASGATVEFGSLTFYSGDGGSTRGDVVIHETNATELASRRFEVDGTPVIFINQADSLVLISDGALTDADSDGSMGETILRASVDVANSSMMIAGGQILLADQALVTVDGVDLGVYSLGLSDNAEDNDIALFATTGGDDIHVGVADAVATDSGATVEVDGLTFYTDGGTGNVYLQTDSDTLLANRDFAGMTYENLANDVVLRTTGMIGSAGGETTQIVGDARFIATGDISLVNSDPAALLVVGGNAFFQSGGAVSVGTGTSGANFGTLSFDAMGDVKITESNAAGSLVMPAAGMAITNTKFNGGSTNHAGSLTLISDSFIEDDASTTVEVDGKATLTAKTTITLGDNAGDTFVVGGDAAFTSTDGKTIDLGVTPTTQLATDRGTDSGATVEFGSLQVTSVGGDVTVHEDLGTLLAGDNQAGTLVLVANQGDIRDRTGTSVTVSDFAEFHAENSVVLADEATDVLTVSGNALFTSGNSTYFATPGVVREISVGVVDVDAANNPDDSSRGTDSGATVSLGSVTFNGFANMDAGAHVTIREDESIVITHAERREGGGSTEITNFAQTAMLIADNVANDATITDTQIDGVGGTSIETTSYAVFQADSHIVLANEAADSLKIGDNAYFASQLGDIDLGVTAKAINALDRGADSGASVQFGTLTFVADIGDVTIHEDDDTTLNNGNPLRGTGSSANSLVLESSGAIEDTAGTSLIVAQLTTAPTAGSAEDQVDGLAVLRAGTDVHLGDSSGDSIDFRRLSLSVGGDVSITETSATDGGLLLLDGSQTAGTMALKTDGHLVQINDERTGAVATTIFADQTLLVAGGGIVMTNVDFNTATLQAHGTLQVTPGATLNADDAANGGLLGRRTTDAISSYLPDSNDDTFAPKGPSTTPETETNMDGAYSIVLSDVNSLTIGLVTDAKGTIAADPVTLAFDVANSDSMATADFKPALSAVGVSAGHMFVQTGGDLNFSENAADPLDNVVVFGEVRMTGGTVTNNAFTALAGGNLNINGDSMLVMRSAADFYMFNPDNNTLTPYVGGGLSDSVGSLGAVHSFATFVDVDTQPGFIQVGEFGPIYQRTAQSPDPDASTSQIAKGLGNGQFQVNATITQLGDSSTMDVNGQPVYVEQNQRVLVDWGDGSQSVYLFKDPIDGAQTLQHTYNSGFALTEQRATVTITVYNDPQINLYDNVVDETNFRDLNSVTDTFEVIIPVGVQFAPEPPPFAQPSAPVVAPVVFLPDVVFAVTTNSSFESDGGSLNQVQEVVVVIVNALDEEVGERIVLQGFSTIEEVKQYIQENTRFLPGRYKVSILLAGQQEPDVYYFEKVAADSPEGASGAANSGGKFEGFVRVDGPHAATEASAEQVWTAQYEKWFEADEEGAAEQTSPVGEEWTPDLSAVLLREERAEAEEEQTSLRKRWMLPGGIGGALMMAAYALRPQEDRERSAAVDEALEKSPEESTDAKFSVSRRRWRRRVR
ncbi:hypothetical protein LOC68_21525 [Blastopirellula sp. JC732]|uniref:Uncharacterized protein n=1 Tax=Blastopirellula sediminis TaxID=2894196 RepID=A0A9X1MSU7_9BACT|nr:hypothetical protein [Blastopirellula sediminis]MCC9605721.1 hypothetical protein [Blastopirellula sediminis]MCC9630979.1 hypothetical protein [Blastopirellula sediminis]